jgi:hypothetical protein
MNMPKKIECNSAKKEVKIYVVCPLCKKENFVLLTHEQYVQYIRFIKRELHIQHALPKVTADDRELLMTGICKECYDAIG